jgi:hypothetical protein
MTQEIAHQPCPYVECGSSDAFSFNTSGFGKCHACDRSYPSKYQKFEWAAEKYPLPQGSTMTSNVRSLPQRSENTQTGSYIAMRGITQKTMEDYGVLTYPDRQEYVYPSGGKNTVVFHSLLSYTPHSYITTRLGIF